MDFQIIKKETILQDRKEIEDNWVKAVSEYFINAINNELKIYYKNKKYNEIIIDLKTINDQIELDTSVYGKVNYINNEMINQVLRIITNNLKYSEWDFKYQEYQDNMFGKVIIKNE